jgi:hypothetical protein
MQTVQAVGQTTERAVVIERADGILKSIADWKAELADIRAELDKEKARIERNRLKDNVSMLRGVVTMYDRVVKDFTRISKPKPGTRQQKELLKVLGNARDVMNDGKFTLQTTRPFPDKAKGRITSKN